MTLWTPASDNGMVCTRLIILQLTILNSGTIFLKTYLKELESSQKETETGESQHFMGNALGGIALCSFSPGGTLPQILH